MIIKYILVFEFIFYYITTCEGKVDYCKIHRDHSLCESKGKYRYGNEDKCVGRKAIRIKAENRTEILKFFNDYRRKVTDGRTLPGVKISNMSQLVWNKELAKAAQNLVSTCSDTDTMDKDCPRCLHFGADEKIIAKAIRINHVRLPASKNYNELLSTSKYSFRKHRAYPLDGTIKGYEAFARVIRSQVRYIGCGRIAPSHIHACISCLNKPAFMFEICLLGNGEFVEDEDVPNYLEEYELLLVSSHRVVVPGQGCKPPLDKIFKLMCTTDENKIPEADPIVVKNVATYPDYCTVSPDHVFCNSRKGEKYTNQRKCTGHELVEMTNADRQEILTYYNNYRQLVAEGKNPFTYTKPSPKAANMKQLNWSTKLERAAEVLVVTCEGIEEKCAKCIEIDGEYTMEFMHFHHDFPLTRNFEEKLMEYGRHWRDHLYDKYIPPSGGRQDPYGTFTRITNAKTELIGCARLFPAFFAACVSCEENLAYLFDICLLSPARRFNVSITLFEKGEPASKCPTLYVPSTEYPGLCSQRGVNSVKLDTSIESERMDPAMNNAESGIKSGNDPDFKLGVIKESERMDPAINIAESGIKSGNDPDFKDVLPSEVEDHHEAHKDYHHDIPDNVTVLSTAAATLTTVSLSALSAVLEEVPNEEPWKEAQNISEKLKLSSVTVVIFYLIIFFI